MDLNCLLANAHTDFGSKQLGHRRFFGGPLPVVLHRCGSVHQQPRGIDLRRHVGQLELDCLKFANGFAELLSLARITQCRFVSALCDADSKRRDRDSPAVQDFHRIHEAHAFFADAVFVRHKAVLESNARSFRRAQAKLVLFLRRRKAGHAFLKDKAGYSLTAF